MYIPQRIKAYLDLLDVSYVVTLQEETGPLEDAIRSGHIDAAHLARAVILQDDMGTVMAVIPAGREIDFDALRAEMSRDLRPAPGSITDLMFPECRPGAIPPLGSPYGVDAVLDQSLADLDEVLFEPGNHDCFVRVSGKAFQLLHAASWRGDFSRPAPQLATPMRLGELSVPPEVAQRFGNKGRLPADDLKRRLQQLRALPAMPDMASRLLTLRNDPRATIRALSDIVERDPSLAAQITRYARSAFFGYRGKVETIHEAITRVLGFEMSLNVALGFAVGRSLRMPAAGPLGLGAFWRHSIYTAALSQALATRVPPSMGVKPAIAYLAGLLHDFGYLLVGHLFPSEFELLNAMVEANPEIPVPFVEKQVLGIEHAAVGGWLLESWNMPEQVIAAARGHHDEFYGGEHAAYANLVLVADYLLKGEGIGDGTGDQPPQVILTGLGLERETVHEITRRVLESQEGLEQVARQLAA